MRGWLDLGGGGGVGEGWLDSLHHVKVRGKDAFQLAEQSCNLWALLRVCVKDIRNINGGGPFTSAGAWKCL